MRTDPGKPLTDADFEALASFRRTLRTFLRFVEDRARAAGLTPRQHALLIALRGQPGRDWATLGELADALQIRHHTAVGLVDRCVKAGLVRRTRSAEDRRRVEVRMTARGKRLLDRLTKVNRHQLLALRASLNLPFLEPPAGG